MSKARICLPPTVVVSANYTGANAYAVEDSVTRPLEDKINGVQGSIYTESSSTSTGQSKVTVYFETISVFRTIYIF